MVQFLDGAVWDGRPMYLAQWPNKEEARLALGKIIDGGSAPRYDDFSNRDAVMEYDSARISGWEPTDDQWIYGCFNVGWAEDGLRIKKLDKEKRRITTDGPTLYGFKSGRPWNTWYAFNIQEEVDQPGEYYLDRKTGRLFFIPYSEKLQSVTVSMLEEPFFDIRHCSKVEVEHIIFGYSRAALVSLWDTEQVKLAHCTFRNSGDVGVIVGLGIEPFKENRHEGIGRPVCGTLGNLQQHLYADQVFNREGGHDNVIDHCQFYQLAAGGVSLGGGNRLTLEHGNNVVSHCIFHDNNRLAKSYRPAVHITGVGNKVVNCEIANTPSMAILLAGNDHLIEGNYIHDACQEVEDQGAFYYGRNPSECGNVVRRNLFANITQDFGTSSVYIDDGACGLTVEENVFYRGGKQCILLGGGSDNHISHNVFINGNMGVYLDKRLQNWAKDMSAPGGIFEKRLKEVNYLQEPYLSAYPFMKDYWPQDGRPKRNVFTGNVFIGLDKKANHPELGIWKEDDIRPEQLVLPEGFSIEKLLEDLRRKGTKGIWPVIGPRLL